MREVGPHLDKWRNWKVITHTKAKHRLCDTRIIKYKNARFLIYDIDSVVHNRTIIEDALQLIELLGYKECILVGVDHFVRDNKPYSRRFRWKDCYFYNPKIPKEKTSVPIEAMVVAMEKLKPMLKGLRVINTSKLYPRPVFEYRDFEEAVRGPCATTDH
jgi:hypothetical protein